MELISLFDKGSHSDWIPNSCCPAAHNSAFSERWLYRSYRTEPVFHCNFIINAYQCLRSSPLTAAVVLAQVLSTASVRANKPIPNAQTVTRLLCWMNGDEAETCPACQSWIRKSWSASLIVGCVCVCRKVAHLSTSSWADQSRTLTL